MYSTDPKNWFERLDAPRVDDSSRCYLVLVADHVGLELDESNRPSAEEFKAHVEARGARFLEPGSDTRGSGELEPGIVFDYRPNLARTDEILALTANGEYDAVIAAATRIPQGACFSEGGVRIGAGTANMASASWMSGNASSGNAPLMNTPSFNSRATAQMVFKTLLRTRPDLPLDKLDQRVSDNSFDTGEHLRDFPARKLEGQRIAVLGFGNIGREVALLARAFNMQVAVFARPRLQQWIESEGFEFCASIEEAASGAQVLSVHLGLGPEGADGFANAGIVDARVFRALAPGATFINFDRGELVSVADLARAVGDGTVADAAIDADIFLSSADGEGEAEAEALADGPLAAYLELRAQHPEKVLLLPHAAADTDHPSRMAGAIQAADQIIAAIRYRLLANAVGNIPKGYQSLGEQRIAGVGSVSPAAIAALAAQPLHIRAMRAQLAELDGWLATLHGDSKAPDPQTGEQSAKSAVLALNQLATTARQLGVFGPAADL